MKSVPVMEYSTTISHYEAVYLGSASNSAIVIAEIKSPYLISFVNPAWERLW
jgi:hypothetical protein